MKIVIAVLALTFCGAMARPDEVPVDASAELAQFTRGNHLFTANVYKEIIKDVKGNFIMSPFSAEVVLALTNEGAVGDTSNELQTGLSLPSSKSTTQKALKFFLPKLQTSDKDLKLLTANKIYAANDVKLKESFHEIADNIYKAGLENVNFAANVQAAKTINQWVEGQTNNKIRDLIKPDYLDADTKLVLVNALYFSGKWVNPFEEYATRKDKFYKSKDDVSEVDMMHQTDYFRYYENKKLNTKFIELPYQGGNISLCIALPNEIDGLSKLEENIEQLLEPQPFTTERVDLKMPKFKIESEIQLKPILEELGIKKVFTAEADLSGLTSTHGKRLYVDRVVQKAFIDVNEAGTEAAAATAVIVEDRISIAPSFVKPYQFYANKPILYYIKINGVIAFVGKLSKISDSNQVMPLQEVKPTEASQVTENVKPIEEYKPEVENPPKVEGISDLETTSKVGTTYNVEPVYIAETTANVENVETTPRTKTTPKVAREPKKGGRLRV